MRETRAGFAQARYPEAGIAEVRRTQVRPLEMNGGEVRLSQDSADQYCPFEMTCTE